MKKYIFILMIAISAILSSCTTTQKFNVLGTAGTEIYTSSMTHVGTIESNGKAKIVLPSDGFYPYLLSKSPNSDILVPFALDYKKASHTGTRALAGIGYTFVGASLMSTLTSTIMMAAGESEDVYNPFLLGAGGAAVLGAAIGVPSSFRLYQTSYDYQFKYLSRQHANTDLQFTQPILTEPYKSMEQASLSITDKGNQLPTKNVSSSTSKKHLSQKSSKTLRDYGKQTEGTYTGTGKLTKDGETIESYSDIEVKIVRISNDVVSVNVVESNGSEFFESSSKYKITKKKNGSYTLTNSEISSAKITIDKNGQLTYSHPKVNIDGDIYQLKISAE